MSAEATASVASRRCRSRAATAPSRRTELDWVEMPFSNPSLQSAHWKVVLFCRLDGRNAPARSHDFGSKPLERQVNHWSDVECQKLGSEQPADDREAERLAQLGSRAPAARGRPGAPAGRP